jgi:RNA polymerase sigma-70 factor (ECF subfamily)
METDNRSIDDLWRSERPYLLALATRMLHGRNEAEDVVQEAFGRLARVDRTQIEDVRGWLMVVVRHLCLDDVQSAHTRRESVPDAPRDEDPPLLGLRPADPADRVTLDDEVQWALGVVLDRLSPAERTSFVLHDVFGFPFDAIATMVGRTPAACRQLASRARRSIRTGGSPAPTTRTGESPGAATPAPIEVTRHRILAERFIAACAGGNLSQLLDVLDPDVVGDSILVGHGPLPRVVGRDNVARRILTMFGPGTNRLLFPVPVEAAPGVVVCQDGRVLAAFRLDERNGLVHHIKGLVQLPR